MPDWAQIIDDALDILKFDGAVQDTLAELRGKWGAQVPWINKRWLAISYLVHNKRMFAEFAISYLCE